jgi:peptidoglycan/LPS O-acetylase OafA/YrhL
MNNEPPESTTAPARPPIAIDSLTSLRGLAALWVVCHHFKDDVDLLFPPLRVLDPLLELGHIAVPFFFILSGFVLAYNYAAQFQRVQPGAYGVFVLRRWARIYPVHFAALMLLLVLVLMSRRLGYSINRADKFSAVDFVLNLFLVQTWVPHFELNWNGPAWSISSEWFAYLLFPFLCVGLNRVRGAWPAASLVVLGWLASMGFYAYGSDLRFRELLAVVPTFATGCFLHFLGKNTPGWSAPRWAPDLLVLAMALTPVAVAAVPTWSDRTRHEIVVALMITYFVGAIGCFGALGSACSGLWRSRPLVFLGEISYSLYMTHSIVLIAIAKLLPAARFADAGLAARLGLGLAYAALIGGAAVAMYYAVELPCRKRLSRLGRGR